MYTFSVIIPVLNEATTVQYTLYGLQTLRDQGHEIIVVDGGSQDNTIAIAGPLADQVLQSHPSRAMQMNLGAKHASGQILLFLHADTVLPNGVETLLASAIQQQPWGYFDVRLSGQQRIFRIVAFLINLRSSLTSIATGDQCLFVKQTLFESINGYPTLPLMEDIALSKTLRKLGPPCRIKSPVITSSRRWETHGIMRTIILMWILRFAYFIGVDTQYLANIYYPQKSHDSVS